MNAPETGAAPRVRAGTPASLLATLCVLLISWVSCRAPATEVVLLLDTDVPRSRAMTLRVLSFNGAVPAAELHTRMRTGTLTERALSRESGGAGALQLPGSLGILPPAAGGPQTVTVWLRATVSEQGVFPEVRLDRVAQVSFVRGARRFARVFLPLACGARSVGCTSVTEEECTVSVRCREQGATCGDQGACVSQEVPVTVVEPGLDAGSPTDASVEDVVSPEGCVRQCTGRVCGTDGCGGECGVCADRPGATATCMLDGSCSYRCNGALGDCDMVPDNGCETDTATSLAHCGSCGATCLGRANATHACTAGTCAFACQPSFGDCDRAAVNGCEARIDTETNCGACGRVCSGATPVCNASSGTCGSGCTAPAVLCGMSCVNTQTDRSNCGACGAVCPARANAATTCVAGACGFACNAGFADCDRNAANGCEVALAGSTANCGMCGATCPARSNAASGCPAGTCTYVCNANFGDCDGNPANGCETYLPTNTSHCGACGRTCLSRANASRTCSNGVCGFSCNSGFGNCNGSSSDGCETSLGTTSNCGSCGRTCGTGYSCSGGACSCLAPRCLRAGCGCTSICTGPC
ncbi:MAG: hypothetical protein Q8Q09_23920 [Deltaproteobacteria bacterium]|nr:hypothetical protein [Deltaproteobacteria bacterium]